MYIHTYMHEANMYRNSNILIANNKESEYFITKLV